MTPNQQQHVAWERVGDRWEPLCSSTGEEPCQELMDRILRRRQPTVVILPAGETPTMPPPNS